MCAVDYTITDGISDRRIPDYLVPVLNWQLRDEDGRFSAVSVLEDLKQGESVLRAQGFDAEIVDYDDIEFLYPDKISEIAPVGF